MLTGPGKDDNGVRGRSVDVLYAAEFTCPEGRVPNKSRAKAGVRGMNMGKGKKFLAAAALGTAAAAGLAVRKIRSSHYRLVSSSGEEL